MLLTKSLKKTPGTRWKTTTKLINTKLRLYNFLKTYIKYKNNVNNYKKVKNKKYNNFKKFYIINTKNYKLLKSSIILDLITRTPLHKEKSIIKDVFNFFYSYPNVITIYPGIKILKYKNNIHIKDLEYYTNAFINLIYIPVNFSITNIFNYNNLKITYSSSPGSISIKKKTLKKTKFISILLPSNNIKYFLITTLCLLSTDFSTNIKSVTGKRGLYIKNFKKIVVRGVAKNPVDHPNGGRTKTKQPERSPWGWVAKINK